ncbi:hypothetical protein SDC9_140082 [bioreactor metagenome]|uniref:Uncharacterized protein n=1 Tax=bioreactor metagenome TaxID=1076179 RepID=A0A645DUB8_9ZZZZ
MVDLFHLFGLLIDQHPCIRIGDTAVIHNGAYRFPVDDIIADCLDKGPKICFCHDIVEFQIGNW